MKSWIKLVGLTLLLVTVAFVLWQKRVPPKESRELQQVETQQEIDDQATISQAPRSAGLESSERVEEPLDPREQIGQVSTDQINIQDEAGMTPLLLAIDSERVDIALELLKRGADPNLTDVHGTTPLMAAAVLGEASLVQALLAKGGNANTQLDRIGTTLLMHAAREGMIDVAQVLIKFGASVNHQNQTGQTALMLAADMGQAEMIDLLLSEGADRTLQDGQGKRAFDFAQARGLEALSRKLKP